MVLALISAYASLLTSSHQRSVGSATGLPLEKLLSVVPTQSLASVPLVNLLATPPVSASAVGRAAVAAATDPAVPAGEHTASGYFAGELRPTFDLNQL